MEESMIEVVTSEYAEEAPFLWLQRVSAFYAPNYSVQQIADLDDRLAAHIDGLRVAGHEGWKLLESSLDSKGSEDFFSAAVLALEAKDGRFEELIGRTKSAPEAVSGVISALGWSSHKAIAGRMKSYLDDPSPIKQKLGIAALGLHRQDIGPKLAQFLSAPVDSVRIRALRTAGQLGRQDVLRHTLAAITEPKPEARFWAGWSSVLLGDRAKALDTLVSIALKPGPRQMRALQLALHASDTKAGYELLLQLADLPDALRIRIIGSGYVGDVRYAQWLVDQMAQPSVARIAGEAFVNITGADFNLDQLETLPPEDFEDGPTEDPDDENVELPEDIALPWPDQKKIQSWWDRNKSRFTVGNKYFLGQPVTRAHCIHVLKTGFQRQRIAASLHMALLDPGQPLFEWRAPAWRQKRWLETLK